MEKKDCLNSAYSTKQFTFNAEMPRLPRRDPIPSRICERLELAREKPITKDNELLRMLHYKNLCSLSGARSAELKNLDNLINQLKETTTNVVVECGDKEDTANDSLTVEQSNQSVEEKSEEPYAKPYLPTSGVSRKFPVSRLRLPKHLTKHLNAYETDSSPEDKSSVTESKKHKKIHHQLQVYIAIQQTTSQTVLIIIII